jgi:hypothetical protein
VVGTDHPRWGDFGGHRDDMATRTARGLCASGNLDSFTHRMFTGSEITLLRAPGWAGPIYRLNDDGNHRVHTIRMLQLPWIAAAVDIQSTPASWTVSDLLHHDRAPAAPPRSLREYERERA